MRLKSLAGGSHSFKKCDLERGDGVMHGRQGVYETPLRLDAGDGVILLVIVMTLPLWIFKGGPVAPLVTVSS